MVCGLYCAGDVGGGGGGLVPYDTVNMVTKIVTGQTYTRIFRRCGGGGKW